jgi:hypothetical protein
MDSLQKLGSAMYQKPGETQNSTEAPKSEGGKPEEGEVVN